MNASSVPKPTVTESNTEPKRDDRRRLEIVARGDRKPSPREQTELLQKELQCCDRATD